MRLAVDPIDQLLALDPGRRGIADHLVVAGVSNWGAYGIVAHLGLLARCDLLHAAAVERRLIRACVRAGPWTASPGAGSPPSTECLWMFTRV